MSETNILLKKVFTMIIIELKLHDVKYITVVKKNYINIIIKNNECNTCTIKYLLFINNNTVDSSSVSCIDIQDTKKDEYTNHQCNHNGQNDTENNNSQFPTTPLQHTKQVVW